MTGFKPLTQVNVLINNVTRVDLRLEVGSVTDFVTVEASAALRQTSKVDVNVNLKSRAIGNLPLSGYRNFQSLINLVPSATPVRFQNAAIDTPHLVHEQFGLGAAAVIPSSRLNAAMAKLLALVPQPNQAGDVNNFFNSARQRARSPPIAPSTRRSRHECWVKAHGRRSHGDYGVLFRS